MFNKCPAGRCTFHFKGPTNERILLNFLILVTESFPCRVTRIFCSGIVLVRHIRCKFEILQGISFSATTLSVYKMKDVKVLGVTEPRWQ